MLEGSQQGTPHGTPRRIDTIRNEVLAARSLLAAQQAVEEAMTAGARAAELEPVLRTLREAIEVARQTSLERRRHFPVPGSLELWLEREKPAEAPLAHKLAVEARGLRQEIERVARRSSYLARRTVGWYETQLASLTEWVAVSAMPGGDYAPREHQVPAAPLSMLLDKAA